MTAIAQGVAESDEDYRDRLRRAAERQHRNGWQDDDVMAAIEDELGEDPKVLVFRGLVETEVDRQRVRAEASRVLARERLALTPPPKLVRLDRFLDVADDDASYRIGRLQPIGARVVLAAQHKTGKTTTLANLIRALVDGEPFLGRYDIAPITGAVALIDDELDERMLRRWLRDQDITNTTAVHLVPLRGHVSSFDLLDPETRTHWATQLAEAGISYVILDCLRPVLDALGLDESKEAGRFLTAFDALLAEAGAAEALVTHHMGHTGERARGDSRIRDWPDVEWKLVRERNDDEDADDNPAAPRYFTAYGRDVDEREALLSYDPDTRRLSIGGGTRRETRTDRHRSAVTDWLVDHPGASKTAIEKGVGGNIPAIRAALHKLIDDGEVIVVVKGQTHHHTLASTLTTSTPSNPVHPVSDAAEDNPVPPSIGTGYLHADSNHPVHDHDLDAVNDDQALTNPTTAGLLR